MSHDPGDPVTWVSPGVWDALLASLDEPGKPLPSLPGEDQPDDSGLTEAEYTAALPRCMARIADDLTATLPDWAQDAGLHFEWSAR